MNENEFLIELQAKLDEEKSKGNINSDIDKIQGQIDKLKIQAEIDPKVVQKLADDIGKLTNQKIVISNIEIDANAGSKAGQEYGRRFNQGASQGIKENISVLNSFKKSLENIGMGSKEIDAVASRIEKLGIRIESLNQLKSSGKKGLLSVDISGADEYGQAIKLTQQYNSATGELLKTIDAVSTVQQKSGNSVDKFIEKQKNAVASAQNTLATIESKLHDAGANKTLANTDFNANGLNTQINAVKNAIDLLGNANLETFSQAQRDVDKEINALNNLISTLKNAEYAATSLRTKDITTVKIDEGNKLDAFVQKMKQSGHYTDELKQSVSDLRIQLNGVFNKNDIDELTSYLNGFSNLQTRFKAVDEAAKTIEKSTKLKANIDSEKKILQTYTNELKEAGILTGDVKSKVQEMFYSLSKVDSQNGLTTWRAELKGVKTEIDSVLKSLSQENTEIEKLADKVYGIQLSMEGKNVKSKNYDLQIETEIKKLKDLGFTDEEVSQKVKALTDAQAELKRVMDSGDFDSTLSKNKAIIESDNKRTEALNQVRTAYGHLKNDESQYYNLERQNKLSTNIQNWLSKNTRASKEAKESINAYYRELNGGRVSVDRLGYIEQELKRIDASQRSLNRLGKSVKKQFAEIGRSVAQTFSIASGFMFMTSKTKDAVSELMELDSILTEISKTSDLTSQQLKSLGKSAFDSASEYGRSASDYLTGVQEMYRAGFDNAEDMSKLSILAQAAGDMDSTTANNYLIASDAAYNLKGNVEELNKVLDGQNYITNNAAVSMDDMAQATSEAASIASQYGVQIDELSALIATATSKTRESGSETGNALKSLFVNLQDTTSKPIREAFDSVNISMTEMVNGSEKLKTPIQLLKELSDAFVSLDEGDTRRANILSDIGSKYHANTLSAILSDWGSFEEMLELYSQGMGSAAKEAEKSSNDIRGSLKRLGNTWTDTVENVTNSDAILTAINAFNGFLSIINKTTDALGSIGTIGLGTGLFAGFKNVGKPKMFGFLCY